jgi:hypothetical protein
MAGPTRNLQEKSLVGFTLCPRVSRQRPERLVGFAIAIFLTRGKCGQKHVVERESETVQRRFAIFHKERRKLDQFVDRTDSRAIQRLGKPHISTGWGNDPLVDEALPVVFHKRTQRTADKLTISLMCLSVAYR